MVFSSEDQLDSLSSDIFFSKLLMKSYKYNFIKYRFLSSNPKLESFVGQVLLMVLPSPALALSALLQSLYCDCLYYQLWLYCPYWKCFECHHVFVLCIVLTLSFTFWWTGCIMYGKGVPVMWSWLLLELCTILCLRAYYHKVESQNKGVLISDTFVSTHYQNLQPVTNIQRGTVCILYLFQSNVYLFLAFLICVCSSWIYSKIK